MDGTYRQIGGLWVQAEPIRPNLYFRIETWFREHGFKSIASIMAWWDERKLGR
jgi:hypothetical protein